MVQDGQSLLSETATRYIEMRKLVEEGWRVDDSKSREAALEGTEYKLESHSIHAIEFQGPFIDINA